MRIKREYMIESLEENGSLKIKLVVLQKLRIRLVGIFFNAAEKGVTVQMASIVNNMLRYSCREKHGERRRVSREVLEEGSQETRRR